jgi:hypothetical protein
MLVVWFAMLSCNAEAFVASWLISPGSLLGDESADASFKISCAESTSCFDTTAATTGMFDSSSSQLGFMGCDSNTYNEEVYVIGQDLQVRLRQLALQLCGYDVTSFDKLGCSVSRYHHVRDVITAPLVEAR